MRRIEYIALLNNSTKSKLDEYKKKAVQYESVLTGEITEFVIPDGWTKIRQGAFNACTKLESVTISNSVTRIESGAFSYCVLLTSIDIPTSVLAIKGSAFFNCKSIVNLTIPNTVTTIGAGVFTNCSKLTNVTLGDGFNCNGLDLSPSTKYSVDTIVSMLIALADRTGETAYTLTLGATNLAKLSDEQKAIATDKNWTLA